MPANVESMFSVRQMPWHQEGAVLAGYPGDWVTASDITSNPNGGTGNSAGGFGHPRCINTANPGNLPAVQP